jgi:hypothetical protein
MSQIGIKIKIKMTKIKIKNKQNYNNVMADMTIRGIKLVNLNLIINRRL